MLSNSSADTGPNSQYSQCYRIRHHWQFVQVLGNLICILNTLFKIGSCLIGVFFLLLFMQNPLRKFSLQHIFLTARVIKAAAIINLHFIWFRLFIGFFFREAFYLFEFDIQEFEESLLLLGTDDESNKLVHQLVIKLLQGCLPMYKKRITQEVRSILNK